MTEPSNIISFPQADTPEAPEDALWRERWLPVFEEHGEIGPDGQVDPQAIKRELYDYWHLMDRVSTIYPVITGGALSKPGYTADSVLSVFRDYVESLIETEVQDALHSAELGRGH